MSIKWSAIILFSILIDLNPNFKGSSVKIKKT